MIEVWSRWSGETGEPMPAEILVRLGEQVARHPWWRARASLTTAWLRRLGIQARSCVLDAGCGWGVTLDALERAGYRATGLDVCEDLLGWLDARRPDRRLIACDLAAELPKEQRGSFDAVTALDVIEHIDDDQGAVRRLGELLKPGGILLLSVPARPDLQSEFDVIQGHRRRYTPNALREAFEGSGLVIERLGGWGKCLVPAAKWQRRGTKAKPGEPTWQTYERYLRLPSRPVAWVLRILLEIEGPLTRAGWGTSGTSLFVVARRPVSQPRHAARRLRSARRNAFARPDQAVIGL